jgi:hypothetical protein
MRTTPPPGRLNIHFGSVFHAGPCMACREPERGSIVTVFEVGDPPLIFQLCPAHHNVLFEELQHLGKPRVV